MTNSPGSGNSKKFPNLKQCRQRTNFVRTCTSTNNREDRYVVPLPFRSECPTSIKLGFSRKIALSQFTRNERLLKSPEVKSQYDSFIEEYSTLSHMTNFNADLIQPPNFIYYLLHYAVFKPDITTTKLRVLFNALSPSSNGVSLNSVLYPGATLQSNLTIFVVVWKLFRYAFNVDKEKMYRQRILFRRNPKGDIKDYELKTVTFGVRSRRGLIGSVLAY